MTTITATATATARPCLTLAEVLADSRVMAVRQLRKILRRPMYVVYLFVQPVLFVLLFRYVLGGVIHTGGVSYVNYLMPGIIVMTVVFGAVTTGGSGSPKDLKSGVVDRLRALPISRSAVLIGRTAADLVTTPSPWSRCSSSGRRRVPAEPVSRRSRWRWCWSSRSYASPGSARTSA